MTPPLMLLQSDEVSVLIIDGLQSSPEPLLDVAARFFGCLITIGLEILTTRYASLTVSWNLRLRSSIFAMFSEIFADNQQIDLEVADDAQISPCRCWVLSFDNF